MFKPGDKVRLRKGNNGNGLYKHNAEAVSKLGYRVYTVSNQHIGFISLEENNFITRAFRFELIPKYKIKINTKKVY